MKSAIIYCQIHILRGIYWVIRAENIGQDSIRQHIALIIEAISYKQYYKILDVIESIKILYP